MQMQHFIAFVFVTILLFVQFHHSLSLPFRQLSEFSLFQQSFVTVEDIDEGVLYQSETPNNNFRQFHTDDLHSPNIWTTLTSCHNHFSLMPRDYNPQSSKPGKNITDVGFSMEASQTHDVNQQQKSNYSHWCLYGRKVPIGSFSGEIDKMRSIEFPLAHSVRSYFAIELLLRLLKYPHIDQHHSGKPNSTVLRLMQSDDTSPHVQTILNNNHPSAEAEFLFFQMENPDDELPTSKSLVDLNVLDVIGIALIAAACTIAACVGVGGGGMLVPILILMLGFSTHESTGLAQALMVGGTLAGLFLNWRQHHPVVVNRPLIDVTMMLLLAPMQISGANVGVLINRMIPSWLIIGFTIVLLGFSGYTTFVRGIEAYRKDHASKNRITIAMKNEAIESMKNESFFFESKVSKKQDSSLTVLPFNAKPAIPHLSIVKNVNTRANNDDGYQDTDSTPSTKSGASTITSIAVQSSSTREWAPSTSNPYIDELGRLQFVQQESAAGLTPTTGMSDFATIEYDRTKTGQSTSFSETIWSDASSPALIAGHGISGPHPIDNTLLTSYQSVMSRHRYHCYHNDRRREIEVNDQDSSFLKSRGFSMNSQMRAIGDILLVSILSVPTRDGNRTITEHPTIVVGTCKASNDQSLNEFRSTFNEGEPLRNENGSIPTSQSFSPSPSMIVPNASNSPLLKGHRISSPTLQFSTTPLTPLPENHVDIALTFHESNLQSPQEYYISDESLIGILLTERQISDLLQHSSKEIKQLSSSLQSLSKHPSTTTTTTTTTTTSSLRDSNPYIKGTSSSSILRKSSILSKKSQVFKILYSTPILRSLTPSNKLFSHESIHRIYTHAMTRYVQTCMTSDACVVLNCCFTDGEIVKGMEHQTGSVKFNMNEDYNKFYSEKLGHWDTPLLDGKIMKFQITKIEDEVIVIGGYRVTKFEVVSYQTKSSTENEVPVSLELVEIRPLFERITTNSNDNEFNTKNQGINQIGLRWNIDLFFEPHFCALFVTRASPIQYELPNLVIDIKQSSDGKKIFSDEHQLSPLKHNSSVDVSRMISFTSTSCTSMGTSPVGEPMLPTPILRPEINILDEDHRMNQKRRLSIERPLITKNISKRRHVVQILQQEESRQYDKWLILIVLWIINSALILSKGGKTNRGLVLFCGPFYWTILISSISFPLLVSLYVGRYVIRYTNLKLSLGVPFVEGELIYTGSCVFHLLIQTFAAGVAAGVVGIGGGMVLGPIMLSEGISPQVTTAVNSTLVLFASSSAALNFMIGGQADPTWSSFLFFVGFVSSLIGKYVLDRAVERYSLSSILVFLLLFIIILSTISMISVLDVVAFGFTGFCSPCA